MLLSESANYLVEDFEENVARKRLNELDGTFDVQGDEANFFDTGFPFAKYCFDILNTINVKILVNP